MSYARETISLQSVAPDLIPQDAPGDVWNDGLNVHFKAGETHRAAGDAATLIGATPGARTMQFVLVGTLGYWVYATNSGIYAHDGSVEQDITPAGWLGDASATFSSCVLNGVICLNASDRDAVYWPGPGQPCQVLPGWGSRRCLALRAHKSFLFAVGLISDAPQRVAWSDAADAGAVPQSWDPAADNLAGFVDLAPASSPCLEAATLRNSLMVYKGESVWQLDFVGGQFIFQARQLFAERGIANTNALAHGIDEVHLFVGSAGDVLLTDGVRVTSVLEGRAQRTFYADFTANRGAIFAAATLEREKAGLIMYPTNGNLSCTRALVFDFTSQHIGFRELPGVLCAGSGGRLEDVGTENQWDDDDEAWDATSRLWDQDVVDTTLDDVLIAGDFGFAIISDPNSNDFLTGPVAARVSKSGVAFGNPQRRKMVNRIWPKVSGQAGQTVNFRLGGQDITGGPITLEPAIPFRIGDRDHLDVTVQGRFLHIEVTSQGGGPWRLGSMDLEFREVGLF